MAVAVNSGLVDYPKGFDKVWSAPGLNIWRPQPPKGYVALGCFVSAEDGPPPLSALVCVHREVRPSPRQYVPVLENYVRTVTASCVYDQRKRRSRSHFKVW